MCNRGVAAADARSVRRQGLRSVEISMPEYSKAVPATLLAFVLVGCDSTSPASSRMLHVRGGVLVVGLAPTPSLDVVIQAWPTVEADGSSLVTGRTDAAGLYSADLGPFQNSIVDSVQVRVTQYDCG